jgi:hypothetical protein
MRSFVITFLGIASLLIALSLAHPEAGGLRMSKGYFEYGMTQHSPDSRIIGPGVLVLHYLNGTRYWRVSGWWLVLPGFVLLIVANGKRNKRLIREERLATNQCLKCSYDLRGSGDRCPECGTQRA